jgi:hypothetical protein
MPFSQSRLSPSAIGKATLTAVGDKLNEGDDRNKKR